jgi:NAD(P)-dependent dehydrogenase (short-subunit alcohol dehydrogenase family)
MLLRDRTNETGHTMEPSTLIDDRQTLDVDEDSLTGRVVLVTGGTRGIGAAICRSLLRRGAVVAAGFSSDVARAATFRDTLDPDGLHASVHQGNVGDPDDCLRVVHEVIEHHSRLDILVNNAGVTVDRPISVMSVDDWHNVLRVNLSGAFYMSKPALAHMLERGSGRIINISSVVAETGNVGQANYAASKSGLLGLTKSLAREAALALAKTDKLAGGIGLTVNAVTPGLIETDMTAAIPDKAMARIRAAIPIGRIRRPEEVARVVRFLAADSSSYITGQVWGVNGGYDM